MSRLAHSAPRLAGLEGLRGLAALGIVAWHQVGFSVTQPILGHAFKGVGLFFMISGFVLAFGYEERLKAGLSPWAFAVLRLRRLYPLYLAGTVLGFALAMVGLGLPHVGPIEALRALPAAFGLWPGGLSGEEDLFPLNAPAWSLYLELLASLVYALALPFLSGRVLMVAALVGFIAMEGALARFGTLDGGWNRASFLVGVARVLYAFPAGVLLHRLWRTGRLRTRAIPVSWVCLAFVLVIAVPQVGRLNALLELLISGLLWPCLVILAANARCAPWEARLAHRLGEPSFALYALHFPVVVALDRVVGPPDTPTAILAGIASVVVAWLLAMAATRWIDSPIRQVLGGGRAGPALA